MTQHILCWHKACIELDFRNSTTLKQHQEQSQHAPKPSCFGLWNIGHFPESLQRVLLYRSCPNFPFLTYQREDTLSSHLHQQTSELQKLPNRRCTPTKLRNLPRRGWHRPACAKPGPVRESAVRGRCAVAIPIGPAAQSAGRDRFAVAIPRGPAAKRAMLGRCTVVIPLRPAAKCVMLGRLFQTYF